MLLKLYSVFDSKVEEYEKPFTGRSHGEVLREITSLANDGKSRLSLYAPDFTLFYLGDFDTKTAQFDTSKAKISLANVIELVKESPIK